MMMAAAAAAVTTFLLYFFALADGCLSTVHRYIDICIQQYTLYYIGDGCGVCVCVCVDRDLC